MTEHQQPQVNELIHATGKEGWRFAPRSIKHYTKKHSEIAVQILYRYLACRSFQHKKILIIQPNPPSGSFEDIESTLCSATQFRELVDLSSRRFPNPNQS